MGCWCGFKLAVIDGIWHQGWWGEGVGGGSLLHFQLLMATQTQHLTPILLSFSPGTSLGPRSHIPFL